ncbi:flagellar basal body rod protein FlgB [Savagea sp. SN6]|uniref:Flagellar basal body rod protein FlgB n=1 Tax=Savagea serpentis TaxID=2785297 RepID=A0A8J7G8T5_9BACL|nr:flagellar basal body rod protein FlgB [Savagea serpentis]MBF4499935.1 flagellar basal body rod protein FlgB [Savagea serpentis]
MLFSSTIQNLEKGLDYAALTQKTIAQNIANVDTPNYKSKAVSFQDVFNEAKTKQLEAYRTDERHIPFARSGELSSIRTYMKAYRHTGNGVDMDKEQANMAENQIYYNALIDRLNGKFNSLQQVIKGGR